MFSKGDYRENHIYFAKTFNEKIKEIIKEPVKTQVLTDLTDFVCVKTNLSGLMNKFNLISKRQT